MYLCTYIITQPEDGFTDKPKHVASNKIISTWLQLVGFTFSLLYTYIITTGFISSQWRIRRRLFQ